MAAAVDAVRGPDAKPEPDRLPVFRPAVRGVLAAGAAVDVRHPTRLAGGGGLVWVTDDTAGTLTRIDPARAQVTGAVAVGERPTALAAGGGTVWVLEERSRALVRVDPRTLRVAGRVPLPFVPTELALSGGSVWVSGYGGSAVARVDVRTSRVALVAPVDRPTWIAVAGGLVWVLRPDAGAVVALDPRQGRLRHEVRLAEAAEGRPEKLVAAAGRLWVTVPARRLLVEVDPRRREPVRLVDLRGLAPPFDVAVDGSALWLQSLAEVVRLDTRPRGTLARGPIRLARAPGPEPLGLGGLAVAGDAAWVADTHGGGVFAVAVASRT